MLGEGLQSDIKSLTRRPAQCGNLQLLKQHRKEKNGAIVMSLIITYLFKDKKVHLQFVFFEQRREV